MDHQPSTNRSADPISARHRLDREQSRPSTSISNVAEDNRQQAVSSQPGDDPNRRDPDERTDLLELQGRDGTRPSARGYRQGSVDNILDEDLERERLQPGMNAEGNGGAGADPAGHHEDSNSNT